MKAVDADKNIFSVGDSIWIVDAINVGSKARRLIRCKVLDIEESGKFCKCQAYERPSRNFRKRCSGVLKSHVS